MDLDAAEVRVLGCLTDLLEDEGEELPVIGDRIELAYRPWQILTVAVRS